LKHWSGSGVAKNLVSGSGAVSGCEKMAESGAEDCGAGSGKQTAIGLSDERKISVRDRNVKVA